MEGLMFASNIVAGEEKEQNAGAWPHRRKQPEANTKRGRRIDALYLYLVRVLNLRLFALSTNISSLSIRLLDHHSFLI